MMGNQNMKKVARLMQLLPLVTKFMQYCALRLGRQPGMQSL